MGSQPTWVHNTGRLSVGRDRVSARPGKTQAKSSSKGEAKRGQGPAQALIPLHFTKFRAVGTGKQFFGSKSKPETKRLAPPTPTQSPRFKEFQVRWRGYQPTRGGEVLDERIYNELNHNFTRWQMVREWLEKGGHVVIF